MTPTRGLLLICVQSYGGDLYNIRCSDGERGTASKSVEEMLTVHVMLEQLLKASHLPSRFESNVFDASHGYAILPSSEKLRVDTRVSTVADGP